MEIDVGLAGGEILGHLVSLLLNLIDLVDGGGQGLGEIDIGARRRLTFDLAARDRCGRAQLEKHLVDFA